MGCPGEDRALGGCGRRLNELRGILAPSLTEKHILPPAPHGKAHSAAYASRKGALCDSQIAQNAPFRHVAAPGRCGATPPPGCGALWRMPQLGKRARATPRQPAGRVAPGSADLGSESGLTERRTLPNRWAPECAFPLRHSSRMRFSVKYAFSHLGKRGAASRKSTFCNLHLTEKHILQPTPHGKAHSATYTSRKSTLCSLHLTERRTLQPASHGKAHSAACASRKAALCDPQVAQTAPFRDAAAPGGCGATPRQPAGHYGEWLNWANALEQPPASLRGGLRGGPQISVRSLASRKGALCPTGGVQNALFRHDATAECVFP